MDIDILGYYTLEIGKGHELIHHEMSTQEFIWTILLFPVSIGLCFLTKYEYNTCVAHFAYVFGHYMVDWGVIN